MDKGFAGAVVIPALAESATLFATLRSLATNPTELLARFLVIVVVNQRTDAQLQDKLDNLATLERLASQGTVLQPFSPEVMDACYKAAQELYAEINGGRDSPSSEWKVRYALLLDQGALFFEQDCLLLIKALQHDDEIVIVQNWQEELKRLVPTK